MGGFGSGYGSGGKRAGAGRPKTGRSQSIAMSFRFTPSEADELRKRAQKAGVSLSEYVKGKTIGGRGE